VRVPGMAVVISFSITAPLLAQATSPQVVPPAPQLQRAAQAFAQQQWADVLAQYSAIAAQFPAHALSRFRMGVAQMELGQLADAERSLREGERLGVFAGQAAFRLAQLHAEAGRPDSAVAQLLRGAGVGFVMTQQALESDPHVGKLRSHARWQEVVTRFDQMARPCMHDTRHRQLDFWVGDWDVRPTGQPPVGPAARNVITLEYNGCVVRESWKPLNGAGGESFNMYDRSFDQWRQTWVDAFGSQHDYRGKLEGKNMVYYGDLPSPPGQTGRQHTRLTFFNLGPDSVRQFSERSTDGGKTWQVNYDLTYVRRKS
jgi:hypothetical protein